MIANLPLLFAGGNPTSLDKMVVDELECFITFLVHCSWGHDTVKVIQQPQWWPSNVPFSDPFFSPSEVPKDWSTRLKDLVTHCYIYHNSELLLSFSESLARNPPETLKYVDNCDRTISLYQRSSGRLLVTFRNENMLYDRKPETILRKCLLPKRQNTAESMVESVVTEIYLCDTCDEVFDNFKDIQSHERICSLKPAIQDTATHSPEPCQKQEMDQNSFLRVFGLKAFSADATIQSPVKNQGSDEIFHQKSRQRRSAFVSTLSNFPFSSLAGRQINKNLFNPLENNVRQREHLERYCSAPPPAVDPRWTAKLQRKQYPGRYKKTENYWDRNHTFHGQRNKHILDLKSQLLFLNCKPLSIRLHRLSSKEIVELTSNVKSEFEIDTDIEFVSVYHCVASPMFYKSNVNRRKRLAPPSISLNSMDIIDLCSDEEESAPIPCPVACHTSGERIVLRPAVPATPEFRQSTEPDTALQAAQCPPPTVKTCNPTPFTVTCNNKSSNSKSPKQFHTNLYNPLNKSIPIISID